MIFYYIICIIIYYQGYQKNVRYLLVFPPFILKNKKYCEISTFDHKVQTIDPLFYHKPPKKLKIRAYYYCSYRKKVFRFKKNKT